MDVIKMVDMYINGKMIWVVVALLFAGGCVHDKNQHEDYYPEDYFRGDFVTTGEPKLNEEVQITFTIEPITESFGTKIEIDLPEGIELVEGTPHWEGDVKGDEIVSITITVKPVQEGQFGIWAYATGVLDGIAERTIGYFLCFLTSKESGKISRTKFYNDIQVESMGIKIPVGLHLESMPQPNRGEEVVLTFSLLASEDMPNIKAEIVLPEEFIYINGTLEWEGDLKKDQKETFQVTIKTTVVGRFSIRGIVAWDDDGGTFIYDIYVW